MDSNVQREIFCSTSQPTKRYQQAPGSTTKHWLKTLKYHSAMVMANFSGNSSQSVYHQELLAVSWDMTILPEKMPTLHQSRHA